MDWRSILVLVSPRGAGRGFVVILEFLVQEAQVVIQVLVEPRGGHGVCTASASVLLDTLPGPGRVPEFGASFPSSQVDGIVREKCFHYA